LEIWDSTSYWTLCLPGILAGSVVLGYVWPERPWRWSCTLVAAHSVPIFGPGLWMGFAPYLLVGLGFGMALSLLSAPFAYGGAALRVLRN
jgi:hypothetical protein